MSSNRFENQSERENWRGVCSGNATHLGQGDVGASFGEALPARQLSTVHGIIGSKDGLIYVADRRANRIQVLDHSGEFVAEKIVAPATLASGSALVFAPSPDPDQRWLYMADGTNNKIGTLGARIWR